MARPTSFRPNRNRPGYWYRADFGDEIIDGGSGDDEMVAQNGTHSMYGGDGDGDGDDNIYRGTGNARPTATPVASWPRSSWTGPCSTLQRGSTPSRSQ